MAPLGRVYKQNEKGEYLARRKEGRKRVILIGSYKGEFSVGDEVDYKIMVRKRSIDLSRKYKLVPAQPGSNESPKQCLQEVEAPKLASLVLYDFKTKDMVVVDREDPNLILKRAGLPHQLAIVKLNGVNCTYMRLHNEQKLISLEEDGCIVIENLFEGNNGSGLLNSALARNNSEDRIRLENLIESYMQDSV
ncbi:hypothetical protein ACFLZ7_02130 [Nanoarchaeota archaeon]